MWIPTIFRSSLPLLTAFVALAVTFVAPASSAFAAGNLDPDTLVATPLGKFNKIAYVQYEAMFEGETSTGNPYRVPCQIIAPAKTSKASGVVVFDWLNNSLINNFGQFGFQLPLVRLTLTDEFLFGSGHVYATVRSGPAALGFPWLDTGFDANGEFIVAPADEFDIVANFTRALTDDPVVQVFIGNVHRRVAFGYSESGWKLRGFVRDPLGAGVFDLSLSGGVGAATRFPQGQSLLFRIDPLPPPAAGGLEMSLNTETDAPERDYNTLHMMRMDGPNARSYEFAGAAHNPGIPETFALLALTSAPDIDSVNPLDWTPILRALFVRGLAWTDGVEPPPSLWLNNLGNPQIARDAKGNALIQYVGGQPVYSQFFRHPEVGVGLGQYIGQFDSGHHLRALSGEFIDLSDTFTSHAQYVNNITLHALLLQDQGYLLPVDAEAIIQRAEDSDVGNP